MLLAPADGGPCQEADPEASPRWSGTAEVFAVATSGNADTRTLGLGGEVVFDPGTWKRLGRVAYVETEAGLAYQVAHTLEVLGGAGFTQEQRLLGDDLSLAIANGTGRYEWVLSETSALTEEAAFVAALVANF